MVVVRKLWALLACFAVWTSAPAAALDSRVNIDRAIELISASQHSLARAYLAPALIDPRLTAGERARAYYLRGFSYLAQDMPVSARKDYYRALEFNPDNAVVLLELSMLYRQGLGVPADAAMALSLLEQSADQGYAQAYFNLGKAYLYGEGVGKNIEQARNALTAAAQQDHAHAMMALAASYRRQHVTEAQPQLALSWYEKAYATGEPGALLSIAFMYRNGEFGEPEPATAIEYFQQALAEGVTVAAVQLAYTYLTGNGLPQDYGEARRLYELAAQAQIAAAYAGLGYMYEVGAGVAANADTARDWYEKGAAVDDMDSLNRLVALYLRRDTQVAYREALRWSKQAAAQGDARALNDYAWLLATGRHDELRNGTLALDQALRAVELEAGASYLDTLAAAYAELGRFDEAIATQQRAIAAAVEQEEDIDRSLELRLQHYQRGKPWRE